MPKIEAIIFDMDGVIIDSEPIHLEIVKGVTREHNLDISDAELQSYVGSSTLEMWTDLVQRYGVDESPKNLANRTKDRITSHYKSSDNLPDVSGVKNLINKSRQTVKNLALASSSSMEHINIVLDKLQLTPYFSRRVSGADLARSKPDPMIFMKASELLETPPSSCLVIEDSYNGVTAAKAAGMTCIGYRNEHSGDQNLSQADLIIDDFNLFNLESFLSTFSES